MNNASRGLAFDRSDEVDLVAAGGAARARDYLRPFSHPAERHNIDGTDFLSTLHDVGRNRSRWLRGHRQKERAMNRKMLYLIGIVLLLIFLATRWF